MHLLLIYGVQRNFLVNKVIKKSLGVLDLEPDMWGNQNYNYKP